MTDDVVPSHVPTRTPTRPNVVPLDFRCWICGEVRSVMDLVIDIADAQVCSVCAHGF